MFFLVLIEFFLSPNDTKNEKRDGNNIMTRIEKHNATLSQSYRYKNFYHIYHIDNGCCPPSGIREGDLRMRFITVRVLRCQRQPSAKQSSRLLFWEPTRSARGTRSWCTSVPQPLLYLELVIHLWISQFCWWLWCIQLQHYIKGLCAGAKVGSSIWHTLGSASFCLGRPTGVWQQWKYLLFPGTRCQSLANLRKKWTTPCNRLRNIDSSTLLETCSK